MTELGPFHLSAESLAGNPAVPKLEANPYSWDHVGNLLILEHPPGTGFSYCHDGAGKLVTCEWDDDTQAEAYLLELEGWFKAFPEYAGRELFITGESCEWRRGRLCVCVRRGCVGVDTPTMLVTLCGSYYT